MSGHSRNRESGLTLVEVLVAGMIGAILIAGIFSTFSVVGTVTEEVTTLQQLRQESVYIDDYVSKWVAQGCSVSTDPAPSQTLDTATNLVIYNTNRVVMKRFYLVGDMLFEDSVRMVTPYLALFDASLGFAVYSSGIPFVDFTYRLHAQVRDKVYYYPKCKVAMACKNGTNY